MKDLNIIKTEGAEPESGPGNQLKLSFVSSTVDTYPRPTPKKKKGVEDDHSFSVQLVREPNRLIDIHKNFTLLERRLYILVLRELKSIQELRPELIKNYSELKFTFHFSDIISGHVNQSMKDLVRKIKGRMISWSDEKNERHDEVVIFPKSTYLSRRGTITLTMYHEVIPLFLNLSQGYSQYQLELALALTSDYAGIIYPYIARFSFMKHWKIELKEFRKIVAVEDKYPNFAHLKRRVIQPLIEQINKLTEYTITAEPVLRGKTVVSLLFKITRKEKPHEAIEGQTERIKKEDIATELLAFQQLSREDAREVVLRKMNYYKLTDAQRNQIIMSGKLIMAFIRADLYIQEGNVSNPDAYIAQSVFQVKDNPGKMALEANPAYPLLFKNGAE